jgi:hypothetical protein
MSAAVSHARRATATANRMNPSSRVLCASVESTNRTPCDFAAAASVSGRSSRSLPLISKRHFAFAAAFATTSKSSG